MSTTISSLQSIGSNYYSGLSGVEEYTKVNGSDSKDKKPYEEKLQKEQDGKTDKKSDDELSADEERVVKNLQARDTEVKAHEAAHQAAGGGMTGAASYTYKQGPDGKMYAVGGEVSISTKGGSTPEEALRNAKQVAAAAMAPANPSPQDYSVASSARMMEMKALQQIAKQQQEEIMGKDVYSGEANKNDDVSKKDSGGIDIPA